MYCSNCGFESPQATKYCKRCGENLNVSTIVDPPKSPRLNVAIIFIAIVVFGILGMITLFEMYESLWNRGARGDELIVPFVAGLVFMGGIAGLLVWQLSRVISANRRTGQNVVVERHFIREVPQSQLGVPTDQIAHPSEYPSVVEHTTRQFANLYESSKAEEKTGTR